MNKIKEIIIDKQVSHLPMTSRIIKNTKGADIRYVDDVETVKNQYRGLSFAAGEKILLVTQHRGPLTKLCPGITKEVVCCDYYVINNGMGCPIECTYCFLQEYLNNPILTLYANLYKIYEEIDHILQSEPNRIFRFGTGELTDSLVLDPLTESSRSLMQFFARKKNALLELKTKTVLIDHLLDCYTPNIIFSWSLNPDRITASEEHKSAGLCERLEAAKRAKDAGFKIGFHFDPIIYTDNWEKLYSETIDRLFAIIDAKNIAWISMGTLRFAPGLKGVIQERFPKSNIIYAEQIQGIDGKIRYIKPLRLELYRKIYRKIRQKSPDVFCYLCMETWDVWHKVMDYYPKSNRELDCRFELSLKQRFPDLH